MRKCLLFLILLFVAAHVSAQLSVRPFADMRGGDDRAFYAVGVSLCSEYGDGRGGTVWCFDRVKGGDRRKVRCVCSGDTLLTLYDSERIRRYSIDDAGFSLKSYENPLAKLCYHDAQPVLTEIVSYGDSVAGAFAFSGDYCGKYALQGDGVSTIKGVAYGMVVENGRDTVGNVLLVSCVGTSRVMMSAGDTIIVTDGVMEKVDEARMWFSMDTGRLLYKQDVQTINGDGGVMSSGSRTVRIYGENEFDCVSDNCYEMAATHDADVDGDEGSDMIVDYSVSVVGGKIVVNYNLTSDAEVEISLCDVAGIPYYIGRWSERSGTGYSKGVNTSGLRRGSYVVNIKANGEEHGVKVNVD